MNYAETLDYLFSSLKSFQKEGIDAYKPGLERIQDFCRRLGNPQRNYFVVHVAGTNGKGSVSHMIASVLQQAGYQTGLFTSPHLKDFRERIRVNGEMIPKQKVVNFIDRNKQIIEDLQLSFFEMTTAMAFDYFAQSDCEVAVIETGLGGAQDATNIVIPVVSVITNIGLEHTEILGDSLPKIAREKGGIIKKSIPVIVGEKNPNYNLVLEEIARDLHSPIIYASEGVTCTDHYFEDSKQVFQLTREGDSMNLLVKTSLLGEYQKENVITATAVISFLQARSPLSISKRAFLEGMKEVISSTNLRGRWEVLSTTPYIVCDTGHNAHGVAHIAKQLSKIEVKGRKYALMGFCKEKNVKEILSLLPKDFFYVFTEASTKRAMSIQDIYSFAKDECLQFKVMPTVDDSYAYLRSILKDDDMLFIGGSTYVVAEVLE